MAKVQLWGYRCERCQHEWLPRKDSTGEPKVCPKCKSPYWDKPRKAGVRTEKQEKSGPGEEPKTAS